LNYSDRSFDLVLPAISRRPRRKSTAETISYLNSIAIDLFSLNTFRNWIMPSSDMCSMILLSSFQAD